MTEQLPETSVQLATGVKLPVPLLKKLTVPVGVVAVPGEVSATVAVQVDDEPTWTDAGLQVTVVVVVRRLTVTVALPVLVACVESPP